MGQENHSRQLSESNKQTGISTAIPFQDIPNLLTSHHLALLWEKMTSTYGHRWISSYGETDDGTWLNGLRGLLPDDLAKGYGRMIEQQYDWPPTLPEFRKLCFGLNEEYALEVAARELKIRMGTFDYNKLTNYELERKKKAFLPNVIRNHEEQIISRNKTEYERLNAPV